MFDILYDAYVAGEVVHVNLVDLLNTLSGSCDCGDDSNWVAQVFYEKIVDFQMSYLIDDILENGLMCPLNVRYSWGEFDFGNGHHRLIAALLCGIEYIDIVVTNDIDWSMTELHDYWEFDKIVAEHGNPYWFDLNEIRESLMEPCNA